jgi:threonine dehydrogenase-like Zn-dependent dehydrogenase
MKATCWKGPNNVQVEEVPDPKIINARDAIVKITSTAICGSDLQLLQAYVLRAGHDARRHPGP